MDNDGKVVGKSSRFKRVCVFCGSSSGKRECYKDAAIELGQELVHSNILYIYLSITIIMVHHFNTNPFSLMIIYIYMTVSCVFWWCVIYIFINKYRLQKDQILFMEEEVLGLWVQFLKLFTPVEVMFLGKLFNSGTMVFESKNYKREK